MFYLPNNGTNSIFYAFTVRERRQKKLGPLSGFGPLGGGGGKPQSGIDMPKISIGCKALSVTHWPKISINLENEEKTNGLKHNHKSNILYDLPGVFNFYKMVVTHRCKLKLRSRKIFAIVAVYYE